MAVGGCVWGIDIGQCGFKALRGRLASDQQTIIAESFDYIEYPKILSQPDADPDELIREAIHTFLSRNTLTGDKVAICVSGQSGLARFIELPPVEPKKLPELVGFEAKQQIPFALEDVVWDYQKMPDPLDVGDEEEDEDDELPTENIVGLFAMKRDQVMRLIRPLVDAEVELDFIQLTPICIYNAITFDQFPIDDELSTIDPDKWVVIFSMGTDSSDVVLTNGFRVWQRSIPIGGNHFTKQLTKEMKLTFPKAEHIKRNAREAEDAREVFRVMRPTFNDIVTEVQRTLGYFESLDRSAEIEKMIAVGNTFKLPGLTQYLQKSLGRPVIRLDNYERLTGPEVIEAPQFKENTLAFPACYGLVLQGTARANLKTNLVPPEILRARMIRGKKPWVAAVAALLLLGLAFNFFFNWSGWDDVHTDRWSAATTQVKSLQTRSSNHKSTDQQQVETLERLNEVGVAAVGSADGRVLWLELIKAVTAALPKDDDQEPGKIFSLKEKGLTERKEIYIEHVESQYFSDLSSWFTEAVKQKYEEQLAVRAEMAQAAALSIQPVEDGTTPAPPGQVDAQPPTIPQQPALPPGVPGSAGPVGGLPEVSGSGWVIEINGYHFQHNNRLGDGAEYIRRYLIDNLESGIVELPVEPGGDLVDFEMKELGILAPVQVQGDFDNQFEIPNPDYQGTASVTGAPNQFQRQGTRERFGQPRPGQLPVADDNEKPTISAKAYRFTVQFCWRQVTLRERLDTRRDKQALAEADQIAAGVN